MARSWTFALAVTFVALASAPAPRAQCCPPRVVVRNHWDEAATGLDQRPVWLATDAVGGVYMSVTNDSLPDHQAFLFSDDDGQSWTIRDLTPGVYDNATAGAVSPDGTFLAIVVAEGQMWSMRSRDHGRTFEPGVRVGPMPNPELPRLAMSPDGRACAAWAANSDHGLWAMVSEDFGRTWSIPARIHDMEAGSAPWNTMPILFLEGAIAIATNNPSPRLFTSWDGGRSWHASAAPDFGGPCRLGSACTPGGQRVVLAAVRPRPASLHVDVFVVATPDGGRTWEDPQLLAGATSLEAPRVACDGDSVLLTWGSQDVRVPVPLTILRSDAGGAPGTWTTAQGALPAVQPHRPSLMTTPSPFAFVAHDDYREDDGVGLDEESIYVSASCDDGRAWDVETRIDLDEPPFGIHSEDPVLAWSATGRLHAAWEEDVLVHASLESAGEQPRLSRELEPRGPCASDRVTVTVVSDSVAWCAAPAYGWILDGERVAGAFADRFVVPDGLTPGMHSVAVDVTCPGAVPCGGRSWPVGLHVGPTGAAGPFTDPAPLLFVTKDGTHLGLRWRDADMAPTAHAVYRGTIASLHERATYDHVPERCLVRGAPGPEIGASVPRRDPDAYYLVTRAHCGAESAPGANSFGVPRPPVADGSWPCGPDS